MFQTTNQIFHVGCLNHVKTVLFLMTQGLKPLIRAVPRRKAQGTTDSSVVAGQDLRIFTAWYSGGAMVYTVYIYLYIMYITNNHIYIYINWIQLG